MKTVVLGPPPTELEALIARGRPLGIDLFDEVWEGSYHMALRPTPITASANADWPSSSSRSPRCTG